MRGEGEGEADESHSDSADESGSDSSDCAAGNAGRARHAPQEVANAELAAGAGHGHAGDAHECELCEPGAYGEEEEEEEEGEGESACPRATALPPMAPEEEQQQEQEQEQEEEEERRASHSVGALCEVQLELSNLGYLAAPGPETTCAGKGRGGAVGVAGGRGVTGGRGRRGQTSACARRKAMAAPTMDCKAKGSRAGKAQESRADASGFRRKVHEPQVCGRCGQSFSAFFPHLCPTSA